MRIKIIRLSIIVLFIIILIQLVYVQVIRGQYFRNLSTNNRIRVVPLEGWRGSITDRNGVVLAENKKIYNVLVTPQSVVSSDNLFSFLAKILEADVKILMNKYKRNKLTPFAPVLVAEDISRDQAIVIEENIYRFPSLFVQENFQRRYPLRKTGAHVLGYVGKINQAKLDRIKEYGYSAQRYVGYTGVEEYYDSFLKGDLGGIQIEVNNRGQQVRLLSLKEPQQGSNIKLTIDHRLQKIGDDLLSEKVGSIVVMDSDSGEILAMTSSPSYDPNILVDKKYRNRINAIMKNKKSPLLNRAINGQFPPGSVFKVPVAICGLKNRKINKNTTFECKGNYELGGINFGCTHEHGMQNLSESIAHSCNIYYYQLGKILGADLINRTSKLFGLGQRTNIDLPYEKDGNIPSRRRKFLSGRRWYTGDTLNMAIGQGDVLATPIQLVNMMASIANDGYRVQPHIIKEIETRINKEYSLKKPLPIDAQVFKTIQRGLRATVTDYSGTAHVLDIKDIHVAGKTGTAQTSSNKEHHAWFVGYAKTKKRNISFCVFLEYGGSSQNSCIVARQLLLNMQNIGFI